MYAAQGCLRASHPSWKVVWGRERDNLSLGMKKEEEKKKLNFISRTVAGHLRLCLFLAFLRPSVRASKKNGGPTVETMTKIFLSLAGPLIRQALAKAATHQQIVASSQKGQVRSPACQHPGALPIRLSILQHIVIVNTLRPGVVGR